MLKIKFVILIFTILFITPDLANAQMKAHFINVGQAESILLEFPTAAILIDAGSEDTGDTRDRDHLIGYLNRFFQRRADLKKTIHSFIISHPHPDHTRLATEVLNNFRVNNYFDGGEQDSIGIENLIEARRIVKAKGIAYHIVEDEKIAADGLILPVLAKLKNSASKVDIRFLGGGLRACDDDNNGSLIVRVDYQGTKFLFTGDAEMEDKYCTPQIDNLLERYKETKMLDVDIYKVGHHGSRNGTSKAFLKAMTPRISVISAGHHSTRSPGEFHGYYFGHPRQFIVEMLEEFSTDLRVPTMGFTMANRQQKLPDRVITKGVYCTCWDGDVIINVNKDGNIENVETAGILVEEG